MVIREEEPMERLMGERVDLRRVSVHPRETFDDDRTAVGSLGTTETMAAEEG